MKKLIFLCLIILIETFAQSEYNIELKKYYCDWNSGKAFADSVETIIRDNNGNIIQPSNDFYYEYHPIVYSDPPKEDIIGGLGLNKTGEDNDENLIQTWYVIVMDAVNQTVLGTSNTVSFQMETEANTAKLLNFIAKRSDGTAEEGVHNEHWMYVVNLWNLIGTGQRYLTINHDEILRASPGFLPANNDKFHYWNTDKSLVLNHNSFYYTNYNGGEDLIANYNTSYGNVNIQNNIDGFSGGSIGFKDPWLIDFDEGAYGMRNQGMNAPYKEVPSPFDPSLGSQYKGVFLNQNPQFDQSKPYYSVSIPSSIYLSQTGKYHNLYLQNWTAYPPEEASFEHPNSSPSGVVFKNDGVTVTANVKGQGLSSDQNTFLNNSQKKIVRVDGVAYPTLQTVYQDMGYVWFETSSDNGQNWILRNDAKPLGFGGGKNPVIDWVKINSSGYIYTVVVFQYPFPSPGHGYQIIVDVFGNETFGYPNDLRLLQETEIYSDFNSSTFDANPTVAITSYSNYASLDIVWQTISGLYFYKARLNQNPNNSPVMVQESGPTLIPNTSVNSINPSIAVANSNPYYYFIYSLVWEENNSIKYRTINGTTFGSVQTISTGSYPYNHRPFVIVLNDGYARISWLGQYYPGSNSRVVFKSSNNTRFWYFGSNARTSQITATDDNTGYYVIWNETYDNSTKFTDNTTLSTIYNLNTTGHAVQLSNGADRDNMYALVYNHQNQPFFSKQLQALEADMVYRNLPSYLH